MVAALKELNGGGKDMKEMPTFLFRPNWRVSPRITGWFPSALEEAKQRRVHLALQPPYFCK
jgi:hypothetical protein